MQNFRKITHTPWNKNINSMDSHATQLSKTEKPYSNNNPCLNYEAWAFTNERFTIYSSKRTTFLGKALNPSVKKMKKREDFIALMLFRYNFRRDFSLSCW